MVSWIVIFWCTPRMTAGHLLFAATTTLYILVAIQLEERDLMRLHGRTYADYRKRVPMLVPFLRRSPRPGSQGDPSLASRGES
jgi:protein-S-isoprenylcysteine O-methyltransferase Ste14